MGRAAMLGGRPVPSQDFAAAPLKANFAGRLVRSFVNGETGRNLNLAPWRWNVSDESRLEVVDDEGGLSRS